MSVETVRSPAEYEERLQRYLFERSEEGRAVRVGEKETSEQAAIVERYADLFSRGQLEALRESEQEASDADERERLYRLRKTCEAGLATAELADEDDELENRILAARLTWNGEEMPLRTAQARLAVLESYAQRQELGELQADASAAFNQDRLDLLAKWEVLEADLSGIPTAIERNEEEKQISLHELERALAAASAAADEPYATAARASGSSACSAPAATRFRARTTPPTCAGCRRSSRRTPRNAPSRCAWTPCATSASTWRTTRTSTSISTTARRNRRAHASSRPIRRRSCT